MSVREDLEHPADDDAPHRRPEVSSRVGEVPGDGRQLAVLGAQHQRQHATVVAQRGVGERPTGGGGGDRRRRRVLVTEQLRQRPPLVVHGSSAAEQLDIDLSLSASVRDSRPWTPLPRQLTFDLVDGRGCIGRHANPAAPSLRVTTSSQLAFGRVELHLVTD